MKTTKQVKRRPTIGISRDEWLQLRRQTVGGSDAAGIIGLSKWATPYTVWADKTWRLPNKKDTEAMRLGRDLEDYVARRWMEETGKKVRRLNAMLYNPAYPFSHADIDRMVIGEEAGLECKTTSTLDVKQFKGVVFPEKYYAQCVHYMAVTGAERWYLAVLVFGSGFFTYTLERDQAEIDALMAAEEDFWRTYVMPDTPPVPDGSDVTADALQTIYADGQDRQVELFGRAPMLEEYARLKDQRKALDGRLSEIENIIKGDMQEAEHAVCGNCAITWKTQERSSFSQTDFYRDYPGIDLSPYYKTTRSRVFRVNTAKM